MDARNAARLRAGQDPQTITNASLAGVSSSASSKKYVVRILHRFLQPVTMNWGVARVAVSFASSCASPNRRPAGTCTRSTQ